MARDRTDLIMMGIFIAVLIFLGISLLINTGKSCDVNIDYNVDVLGHINGTDASIVEIKYACYKLCVDELRGQSSKFTQCLDKCEALE